MSVVIWTTTECNLQCKYCYELKRKQRDNSKLSYIETNKIVEWIKKEEVGKDIIIFHGGEPLIKFATIKKITESLFKIKQLPEHMELTTNGMVWNKDIEYFFHKYKKLFEHNISLSIDGIESVHNKNRKTIYGTGSYEKVIETQNKLIKIFPELRARMTITPDNVGNLYEGIINLINLKFKVISASLDSYDNRWSEEHIQILKEQIIKIIKFWKKNRHLTLPFINDIQYRKPRGKCNFSYNIYPNGDLYPCISVTGITKFCIGNVIEGIRSEKVKKVRRNLNKKYELCENCNNINYCIHYRCRLINYALYNNFNRPNVLGCRIESLKLELNKYFISDNINNTTKL